MIKRATIAFFLFLTILLLPAVSRAATPSVVHSQGTYFGSASTDTFVFTPTNNGDMFLVCVFYNTVSSIAVSDTQSDSFALTPTGTGYTTFPFTSSPSTNFNLFSCFYANNIIGGASTTITITFGSAVFAEAWAIEVSGQDATSPIDNTSAANGNSGSASSGFQTTSAADLVFGFFQSFSNLTFTPTGGFSSLGPPLTSTNALASDIAQGAAGSIAATATLSSDKWTAAMVAIKGKSGSLAFGALTASTNSNAGTFAATGNTWDFSGVTLFKIRTGAGLTTSANGDIGLDTTNKNYHGFANSVDNIFAIFPASTSITNSDCAGWSKASGVITLTDVSCAGGGLPAGPTSPNGVTQILTSTPSGGVAGPATYGLAGVPVRAATGTSDTILTTDRAGIATESNASPIAVTIPNPTAAGFTGSFTFGLSNINTGVVTETPATGGGTINGNANQIVPPNWFALNYTDNSKWFVPVMPTIQAFPSCSASTSALTFTTATGLFGCNSSTAPNINAFQAYGNIGASIGLATAGTTRGDDFWLPYSGVFNNVWVSVGTADATNNYKIGIYNASGTLVCNTTAAPLPTTGIVKIAFATSCPLSAGLYTFGVSAVTVATATLLEGYMGVVPFAQAQISASSIPGSITPPTTSYTIAFNGSHIAFWFALSA